MEQDLAVRDDKAEVIDRVCSLLTKGDDASAAGVARAEYPFEPQSRGSRKYTEFQSMEIFARDGFVDRYRGVRLVCPAALRLLSQLLPSEFPADPNWKMSESHIVFWELFPTVDHVVPIARGGADDASNWVTASMLKNQAKSSWTLEARGWARHPAGNVTEWDGLTTWFMEYADAHPEVLADGYLKRWNSAARRVLRG